MALPRAKKKAPRAAPRVKRGGKLSAPGWDGWEEWTGEQIHRHREFCRAFYYDNFKSSELSEFIFTWMKDNGYSKDDIKQAKAAPSYVASTTAGIIAKQLLDGMPDYVERENEYWESLPGTMGSKRPVSDFLKNRIDDCISAGSKVVEKKEEEEKKVAGPVKTIQERMIEASVSMASEIDELEEQLIRDPENFDTKGLNITGLLRKQEAKANHARIIKEFYTGQLEEHQLLEKLPTPAQLKKMDEAEQDSWGQLKEGYAHLSNKAKKNILKFYTEVVSACEMLQQEAKVTRKPRAKKTVSSDKLVAKLKYLKIDEKNKLVSIDPTKIIGASELWVYNIKTRKLGKYVAADIDPTGQGRDGSGLSVKGTTIVGFNETESIQKTLRKPEEQLKEFQDAGKVKLRKLLDDIKAVDIKLNGRINDTTILLKVS